MQDEHFPEERPPLGFMMAVAKNMHAMEHYAAMDEASRKQLMAQAANVQSQAQMQALVDHMDEYLKKS